MQSIECLSAKVPLKQNNNIKNKFPFKAILFDFMSINKVSNGDICNEFASLLANSKFLNRMIFDDRRGSMKIVLMR